MGETAMVAGLPPREENRGLPLGSEDRIVALEREHERKPAPGRRGRKPGGEIDVARVGLFSKPLPLLKDFALLSYSAATTSGRATSNAASVNAECAPFSAHWPPYRREGWH